MIINIRGTSGSGKSTITREIMKKFRNKVPYKEDGRKQPIGYVLDYPYVGTISTLAIIGHYESDCGGCDTITKMDHVFELIRQSDEAGHHVLYEGLLLSAEVNRTASLHTEGRRLLVYAIDLPVEECLRRVNGRRLAKAERTGREYRGDVNPKNTESKHRGVQSSLKRLRDAGIPTSVMSAEDILESICKELQI